MKTKNNTYEIYYDEEGDFLEITFELPPEKEYTEQVEDGVFITKDADSHEVKSIGILGFKKRTQKLGETLKRINMEFPFDVVLSH